MIAKHHLGKELQVKTDGKACDWAEAFALCQAGLGYGAGFSFRQGQLADAANRQMHSAGRTAWNEGDAELAARTLNLHFPLCMEHPGVPDHLPTIQAAA